MLHLRMNTPAFPSRLPAFTALLVLVGVLCAVSGCAQDGAETSSDEVRNASDETTSLASTPVADDVTDPTPAVSAAASTEAEKGVQEMIKEDGVHVVHFWAPWCPNAKNELDAGWGDLVRDNPDVSFVFVSIWNDNESGASVLSEYDIPERVSTMTLPDTGPSDNEEQRRRQFLGLPVTWSPSTWIFHKNGELAFAMNYGEMQMSTIQQLLDNTQADW